MTYNVNSFKCLCTITYWDLIPLRLFGSDIICIFSISQSNDLYGSLNLHNILA